MVFIIISSQPMENLADFPSERHLSLDLKVERNFSSSPVTSCIKIGAVHALKVDMGFLEIWRAAHLAS